MFDMANELQRRAAVLLVKINSDSPCFIINKKVDTVRLTAKKVVKKYLVRHSLFYLSAPIGTGIVCAEDVLQSAEAGFENRQFFLSCPLHFNAPVKAVFFRPP